MKDKEQIKKEYMALKLEKFAGWYKALNETEKIVFNQVISNMRDEFFSNKSDNNAKEETI